MKKKVIALIAVAALSVSVLTGCGSNETAAQTSEAAATTANQETTAQTTEATESKEVADTDTTIKVAASAVPHAEILEAAKPLLAEQGYTLEIQIFDDYVQPNLVVESGDFDANYFQHIPYLESFNEEKGTHLVNAGGIHLKDGVGLTATTKDIVENPHNISFVELEAAQVPRTLPEVSFGVLNGNYAMEAGLTVADDALLYESDDSEAAATYVNVIAVKEGNENLPKIKALVDTLKSDEIKQFINDNYNGGVIPYK